MRGEEPVTNASPHLLLPSSGHTAQHSVESHPHGFWVPIANQGMEHSPSQKPAHTSSVHHDSRHSAEMTGSKEKVNTTSVSTKFKYLDSQQKDKKKMRCKTESLASPNLSSASAMTAWRPLTRGHQTPHSHSLQFQGRKKTLNSYLYWTPHAKETERFKLYTKWNCVSFKSAGKVAYHVLNFIEDHCHLTKQPSYRKEKHQ